MTVDFWDDEAAARDFLSGSLIDFLPGLPDELSCKDIAFVLGVSQDTIPRLVAAESLPVVQCPRGLFVTKKDFLRWLFSHFLYLKPVNLNDFPPEKAQKSPGKPT